MATPVVAEPVVEKDYSEEIEKARRELRGLIYSSNSAPAMLRLAMHEVERYDVKKDEGRPDGSTRFQKDLSSAENRTLKLAVDLCEKIKEKHPTITYADLYQLAGVVAVEVTGGPEIAFRPGRKDAVPPEKKDAPGAEPHKEEETVPDANKEAAKRQIETYHKMGLLDQDILLLDPYSSGFQGRWTMEPLKFDNSYFKELNNPERKQLHRDKALVGDPSLKKYVSIYAENEDAFFADYAAAYKKLLNLGFSSPVSPPPVSADKKPSDSPTATKPAAASTEKSGIRLNLKYSTLAQSAIGVAVAAAVVILGYVYHVSRRSRPT